MAENDGETTVKKHKNDCSNAEIAAVDKRFFDLVEKRSATPKRLMFEKYGEEAERNVAKNRVQRKGKTQK